MRNINKELHHVYHPYRLYFVWLIFYILLIGGAILLFNYFAGNLRTYTIPSGEISISTKYDTYLVGEPISFTLKNNYNSTVYMKNDCPNEPIAIYRYVNKAWKRQHAVTSKSKCTTRDQLIAVHSGVTQDRSLEDWSSIFKTPGIYRIAVMVEYFNTVAYKDINVIARPKQKVKLVTVPAQSSDGSQQIGQTPSSTIPKAQSNHSASPGGSTPSSTKQTRTISSSGGSVSVAYTSSRIDIISISPASGCTYERSGSGGREVEVTFKCGGSEVQIHLEIENGRLQQEVESDD